MSAAVEVLGDIETQRKPAAEVIKFWGGVHRFAGSGDRAAIAGLVYDALRRKASSAFLMQSQTPRAMLLGMLRLERKLDLDAIARLADGGRHAPAPLDAEERTRLEAATPAGGLPGEPPLWIAGDYPEWLDPQFAAVFGEKRVAEGAALASRAPLDLRVNTLKAERERALAALSHLGAAPSRWSPCGLRIVLGADAKSPGVHAEPAFVKGMVEVQDEGSQLAALLVGAEGGQHVVDLCAGAGGKTLALAAAMRGRGQIYATDADKRRLAPIHARIERAGARNVQVRTPRGEADVLGDLGARADRVLIDAPCTGIGAWRRNPDAKWRLRPGAIEVRIKEQAALLDRAAPLVKPGGRIVYVTCSLFDEENGAQVRAFLARNDEFAAMPPPDVMAPLGERAPAFHDAVLISAEGLLLTPRRTDTDGFFVSVLVRRM